LRQRLVAKFNTKKESSQNQHKERKLIHCKISELVCNIFTPYLLLGVKILKVIKKALKEIPSKYLEYQPTTTTNRFLLVIGHDYSSMCHFYF
jgi:hypothetical protein